MNNIERNQRVALAPGVRCQIDRTTGEPVLLYPEGVMLLNDTARAIIAHCDGQNTMAEIAVALAAEYECSAAELENDITECLDDLQRRKLITFAP